MSIATWQVLTALLPFLLVVYHAMNLWRDRITPPPSESAKPGEQYALSPEGRVGTMIREQYGSRAIVTRYILPAAVIPIVGIVEFMLVNHPPAWLAPGSDLLMAFKYGLFGAYFFVFLELGRRSVRNDITPVSILWCLITLVIGPALAALIPSVFAGTVTGNWNNRALWIVAGYTPRLIFKTLVQGIMKALQVESGVKQEERRIPLGRIIGIGSEEMERLAEEGITDAHALACVDPVRLMRDTRFDNWCILSWVNQALLINSIPQDIWQQLIKRGYLGATDVKILVGARSPHWRLLRLDRNEAEAVLKEIAEVTKENWTVVRDMLSRLVEDPRTENFQQLARALAGWPAEEGPEQPTLVAYTAFSRAAG
jgi:hypothetical protein